MGEVYRARDAKLNRNVALKILSDTFVTDPNRLARFRPEAQVLASLSHPNIAAIYPADRTHSVETPTTSRAPSDSCRNPSPRTSYYGAASRPRMTAAPTRTSSASASAPGCARALLIDRGASPRRTPHRRRSRGPLRPAPLRRGAPAARLTQTSSVSACARGSAPVPRP